MPVWEGRIVSISTISSSLNAVRTAIGDSGDDQRFIRRFRARAFASSPPSLRSILTMLTADLEPAAGAAGADAAGCAGGAMLSVWSVLPLVTPAGHSSTAVFAAGAAAGVLAATLFLLPSWQATPQPRPMRIRCVGRATRQRRHAARPWPLCVPARPQGACDRKQGPIPRRRPGAEPEKAQEAALQGCFEKLKQPCRTMQSAPALSGRNTPCRYRRRATFARNRFGMPLDPDTIPLISAAERKTVATGCRSKMFRERWRCRPGDITASILPPGGKPAALRSSGAPSCSGGPA